MNATPPHGNRRVPLFARAGLLGAGAVLLAGCGSTHVTTAGGGAPGPIGPPRETPAATTPAVGTTPPGLTGGFGIGLPSASATPTPCSPEGVSLAAEEANAAMGLRVMGIRLTNCGSKPYALNGHPALRVLDGERAPLEISVQHGAAGIATLDGFDAAPKRVTLQPQESAVFQLVWRNTATAGDRPSDNGRYLDVAPLPGRPRLTVPADLDLGTTGKLGVSAWSTPAAGRPASDRP
ncbi:DUF4232 domain-containing protein [Kitasatospora sp. NBC_01560]|uniref:DUF4232 domain-containing protein n=1 Tax=Kitasatospora sp. NBC_01560 TaxID=2975965 RepID=UPI0038693118